MTPLIDNDEPEIVTSPLSRVAVVDGWRFDVRIYRLDRDQYWALEVVDEINGSHVWHKTFASGEDALAEALRALNEEGADAFLAPEDREHLVHAHPELAREFEAAAIEMPVSEALGMMAALVSAPTMSSTSDWLKTIVGSGSFASASHAQTFVGHLMTAYNEIVERLQEGDGAVPPSRTPGIVRAWCRGYIEAAHQDPLWIDNEDALELLAPFRLLSGLLDDVQMAPAEAAKAEQLKAGLPPQLSEITARVHELWAEFRLEQAERVAAESRGRDVAFRRDGPKIGRNQPCPCGSGKKYKRCCGATN